MLFNAEGQVSVLINGSFGDAPEVADARHHDVDDALQKLLHLPAPQSDLERDDHALADLKSGDGDARLAFLAGLAGDRGDRLFDFRQQLLVKVATIGSEFAETGIDDDFFKLVGHAIALLILFNIGAVNRARQCDDLTLLALFGRLLVLLVHIDAFHNHAVLLAQDQHHFAALAFIFARDSGHHIAFFDVHFNLLVHMVR